jgi:hypothetical protein
MKIQLYASMLIVSASVFSCASKVMILQSPVVSMKVSDAGTNAALVGGRPVNEKWCSSDKPAQVNDDGSSHYGMIDQVIWKAHKATNANLFKDAKFYQQASGTSICMLMTAEAVDGGGGGSQQAAPASEGASPKAPSGKKPKKG